MKNPLDYGAVGDGTTDDTAAFQAAIAACGERETLHVPPRGYWISATLDTAGKPITLRGEGQGRAANVWQGGSYIFGNFEGPIFRSLYPAQGCTIQDIGFCNRAPNGTSLELSGNCVTVDRVSSHAFFGIRMANSTFSAALRSVHVRYSGFPVGSVGIAIGGHCAVHAADVVGFDHGFRVCGLGVDIRSCRVEVNRTGMLLGVNQAGQTLQMASSIIEGISFEANDIALETRGFAGCVLRGIGIQGTTNSPSGGAQYGMLINHGQAAEFSAIVAGGGFTGATVKIAATNSAQRWSNVLTSNTNAAGKRWDIASMRNLVIEQCD